MMKKIMFGFTGIYLLMSTVALATPQPSSVTVINTTSKPVPVAVQGTPQPYQYSFYTFIPSGSHDSYFDIPPIAGKTFRVKSVVLGSPDITTQSPVTAFLEIIPDVGGAPCGNPCPTYNIPLGTFGPSNYVVNINGGINAGVDPVGGTYSLRLYRSDTTATIYLLGTISGELY